MKLFLVIFFVGCASALTHEVLKAASDDALEDFLIGMSSAPALHEALGIPDTDELRRLESDMKKELENFLREAFDKTLEKIKNAMDKGKEIHPEAWKQLLELKEKMKDLSIRETDFEKETIEQIKEKISHQLKTLLEKLGVTEDDKRSVDFDGMMAPEDIFGDLTFRNFFLKLKEMILEKMDVGALKKGISKAVGQGAKALCEWLTNKGKDKVMNFFDRVLEADDEDRKRRSVSDLYEHIKDYFDELDLDFKQKFSKFGEWVMVVLEKGLDKSKNKLQNVRLIAKQLLEKSKAISKDVAKQALEYMKDYKEELGELYEKLHDKLMEKIMDYTD